MSKGNSTALKISAYISFFMAIAVLMGTVCILFDWLDMGAYFKEMVGDTTASLNTIYKYILIIECIVTVSINIYAGAINYKLAKQNTYYVGINKLLYYVSIIQFLFTSNVISAIITTCVASNLGRVAVNHKSSSAEDKSFYILAKKIENLKQLLKNNEITQEEYDKKLNTLIEESVAEKNKD